MKVVIDKELSDYVQRSTWHPSQRIKELKNGRIVFSMTASGKEEIKAWILSFGLRAKAVSPKFLKEEIEVSLSKNGVLFTPLGTEC